MAVNINGEELSESQVARYRLILKNDCIKFAGEFHNLNRSAKFRANWPNEYDYADSNWKTFVSAVRQMYAQRLGEKHIKPEDAETIHRCLVIDAAVNAGMSLVNVEGDARLQLSPNTEQFVGDRKENAKTVEDFGAQPIHPMDKALLKSTAARFH